MAADWRDDLAKRAYQCMNEFIDKDSRYSIYDIQPDYRGGTNYITFGQFGKKEIVFKYYCTTERWVNELFCLQYFASTHLVPRVLATIEDKMIVMSRLPDEMIDSNMSSKKIVQLSFKVGEAIGSLSLVPLPQNKNTYNPAKDYKGLLWEQDLSSVIKKYINIGTKASLSTNVYKDPFYLESLDLIEKQINLVKKQKSVLFHEDINNMAIYGGKFQGFYDLEMCRLGTVEMQIGVALNMCIAKKINWKSLIRGFESKTANKLKLEDHISILAMNHFYHLIRICRWGDWDGTKEDKENMQESIDEAQHHLSTMKKSCKAIADYVDLSKWFPKTFNNM